MTFLAFLLLWKNFSLCLCGANFERSSKPFQHPFRGRGRAGNSRLLRPAYSRTLCLPCPRAGFSLHILAQNYLSLTDPWFLNVLIPDFAPTVGSAVWCHPRGRPRALTCLSFWLFSAPFETGKSFIVLHICFLFILIIVLFTISLHLHYCNSLDSLALLW